MVSHGEELSLDAEALLSRFIRYARINTQSSDLSSEFPSTKGQLVLSKLLYNELAALGIENLSMDQWGYVVAKIPARNAGRNSPRVGFIAHVDTAPDAPGDGVNPRVISAYDGSSDIVLDPESGISLSTEEFPELRNYRGEDIVVTDGKTLLGADDKAGITAIMEALRYILEHPSLPHPELRIAFTLDEEIGRGVEHFDIPFFDADFAYTIDGGELGELQYENFNAAAATIRFHGRPIHPGEAKGKMVNALLLATEFTEALPPLERPEYTSGREGFFYLTHMQGNVDSAVQEYIIRDHDKQSFNARLSRLQEVAQAINRRFGKEYVTVEIVPQYSNMLEYLKGKMEIVEIAREAMRLSNITPIEHPIRGGTDGARLSELGLPCPNLFAGGMNFHSRYEYLPLQSLTKVCEVIIRLSTLWANREFPASRPS